MARVRRRKDTPEKLAATDLILQSEDLQLNPWQSFFPKEQPLVIEIGTGRGRFLLNHAKEYPEYNHIGIDVVPEILIDAVEKYDKGDSFPDNLRFLLCDAKETTVLFGEHSVERLYLNFSDPWPKKRHAKRRLTHKNFLEHYQAILKPEGYLAFKTDGEALFDFSLESLRENNWTIIEETRDLYAHLPADNIATEYERRFVRQGLPIFRLVAKPPQV